MTSQLAALSYTPTANYHGSDSISVNVTETVSNHLTAASVVAVNVTGDVAPVLSGPSALTTGEGSAVSFTGANAIQITDAENDNVSVTVAAAHGTLTAGTQTGASITLTGSPTDVTSQLAALSYTPTANYHGSDSISVNVTETVSNHLTAASVVSVNVTGDQAPVLIGPSALSTGEGSAVSFTGANAIQITDAENDNVSVTVAAAHGTLTAGTQTGSSITLTGSPTDVTSQLAALSYTPTANYHGSDSISVNVTETVSNHLTAASVVSVNVTGDQAPVLIGPSALSTGEGSAVSFTGANAIQITDAENDNVSVTVAAAHGTLTAGTQTGSSITLTGSPTDVTSQLAALSYTPTANYHGSDSISVNVTETVSNHLTAASVVSVNVTGDQAPVLIGPSALSTGEGSAVSFTGANAIQITDAENDNVSVTVAAAHGTLTAGTQTGSSITLTGSPTDVTSQLAALSYTPTANYHGSDSISVNVTETVSNHLTAASVVSVNVTGDQAPVLIGPSALSTGEGSAVSFTGANAIQITDAENDNVSVTVAAAHGTLTAGTQTGSSITLTGSPTDVTSQLAALSYTPTANYHGSDSISVNVTETVSNHLTAASVVSVNVTGDQAPVLIGPSALSTGEGSAVSFTGANAIQITDAENDNVSVTVAAAHGTLTAGTQTGSSITLTGSPTDVTSQLAALSYTPTANYHGSDSISVNVTETVSNHLTAASVVSVNVTGDQAPVLIGPSALSTGEGSAVSFTGANAIQITDAENDNVSVTVAAAHGTLTAGTQTGSSITLTGSPTDVTSQLAALSYTPTANYHGSDSISVNVTETVSNHLTAASVVSVNVTGDQAPVLIGPSALSTGEGSAVSFTGANAIHITDAENDNVSVTVAAAHGTLTAGTQTGCFYNADRVSD